MRWIIMCQVSGGITGSRQAPLKVNGIIQYFDTFKEADILARDMMRQRNNPNATAQFKYWVERA